MPVRRNPPPVVSGSTGGGWQRVDLEHDGSPWTLPAAPATDSDGDPLLNLTRNGVGQELGVDFTRAGAVLTWIGPALDESDLIIAWYVPGS